TLTAVDRSGAIWQVHAGGYRLARLTPTGDTALVVEVPLPPTPVTAEDRDGYFATLEERFGDAAVGLRGLMSDVIPDHKPLLIRLLTDDQRRVWVGRAVPSGETPLFDVFASDGGYVRTVRVPGV